MEVVIPVRRNLVSKEPLLNGTIVQVAPIMIYARSVTSLMKKMMMIKWSTYQLRKEIWHILWTIRLTRLLLSINSLRRRLSRNIRTCMEINQRGWCYNWWIETKTVTSNASWEKKQVTLLLSCAMIFWQFIIEIWKQWKYSPSTKTSHQPKKPLKKHSKT